MKKRLLLTILLLFLHLPVAAQTVNVHALKAVFLFNFASFVSWPESLLSDNFASIHYCVMGNLRIEKNLRKVLRNEKVNNRPLKVLNIKPGDSLGRCHILFVSQSVDNQYGLLSKLEGKHILTVGDNHSFLQNGGMINLSRRDKRIQIEINLKNVYREKLSISSKLLRLAKIINE